MTSSKTHWLIYSVLKIGIFTRLIQRRKFTQVNEGCILFGWFCRKIHLNYFWSSSLSQNFFKKFILFYSAEEGETHQNLNPTNACSIWAFGTRQSWKYYASRCRNLERSLEPVPPRFQRCKSERRRRGGLWLVSQEATSDTRPPRLRWQVDARKPWKWIQCITNYSRKWFLEKTILSFFSSKIAIVSIFSKKYFLNAF